jgi:hypothetical protein
MVRCASQTNTPCIPPFWALDDAIMHESLDIMPYLALEDKSEEDRPMILRRPRQDALYHVGP